MNLVPLDDMETYYRRKYLDKTVSLPSLGGVKGVVTDIFAEAYLDYPNQKAIIAEVITISGKMIAQLARDLELLPLTVVDLIAMVTPEQ